MSKRWLVVVIGLLVTVALGLVVANQRQLLAFAPPGAGLVCRISPATCTPSAVAAAALGKQFVPSPGQVLRGQNVTYTLGYRILVANGTATGTLRDLMPDELSFVSSSGSCGAGSPLLINPHDIRWQVNQLCSDNSIQTITVVASASTTAPCNNTRTNFAWLDVFVNNGSGSSAESHPSSQADVTYQCQAASLDLKINGQDSATGQPGNPFDFSWAASAGTTAITVDPPTSSDPTKPCPVVGATTPPSGTKSLSPPLSTTAYSCTYTGRATGPGGDTVSDSVSIALNPPTFKIRLKYDERVDRKPPPGFESLLGPTTGEANP